MFPFGYIAYDRKGDLGVWDEVAPRVAQADNARGIGLRRKGRVVGNFPEESHPKILYRVALLVRAQPEARDFLQFLVSPRPPAKVSKARFSATSRPSHS
jgi:ABC-type molybdate transport system substrate-binding protein